MKSTLLARSVAVALALAGGMAATSAAADASAGLVAEAMDRYYVIFDEPGAFSYRGEDARFAATASPREGVRFDANRAEVEVYRAHLQSLQSDRIARFEQVLGRSLEVSYRYDVLFNAIVVEGITASEAAALARQPSVAKVTVVSDYELTTDRGPQFIGADTIWTGASTPSGAGFRGEGLVVGVLDTGLNTLHPAFSNDASCGHTAASPKVVANKNCIGSATCTAAPVQDGNGHGSHVAGTVAGNTHIATGGALAGTSVSGVAPCANLISYRVCPANTCDGAAITAAINTALIDGVDALNYSISGGQNPWSAGDSNFGFLQLVNNGTFVAASAGNTNNTITNPIAAVNHRGPWVMTVANSTHDRINSNPVSFNQGGPQNLYGLKGLMTIPANVVAQVVDSTTTANPLGCNAGGGFPAGSMTGRIAVIPRGTCAFSEKLANAQAAGAIGGIITNNNPGQPPLLMGETTTSIPAVMVSFSNGEAIRAHVAANPTTQATISATTIVALDPEAGDILASSSLRGPIAGNIEVTKPDITGPGTNIFAPVNGGATSYNFLSGTSMSSPHIAGAAVLVMGVQPTWTVTEVKSALQLTAKKTGSKDFVNGTPNSGNWDADDVGNGRVDLTKAARAGLVMHETGANFQAAGGNQANQRALNLPAMRHSNCSPSCTFTRTVRNTLGTATQWNAAGVAISPGLNVSVSPSSFSFTGNISETQVLTVTVQPVGDQTARFIFGEVALSEANNASPDLHMTVAIRGNGPGSPPVISVDPVSITATGNAGFSQPVTRPLNIINSGGSNLEWEIVTGRSADLAGNVQVLWDQPQAGNSGIVSSRSIAQNGGAYTAGAFQLTADSTLTTIFTPGFDNGNQLAASPGITWQIYRNVNNEPQGNPQTNAGVAVWSYTAAPNAPGVSFTGSGVLTLNLLAAGQNLELDAGSYWLTVFPTYAGNITAGTDPRWAWFQANQVGTGSKLIAPNLFGNITSWTLTGTGGLGTAIEDVAFTLSGIQGGVECGAPWLSVSPASGTVAAGQTGATTLSLSAASLAEGVYTANVCISSNDAQNDLVVVPVTFTVGEGLPPGEVDLTLSMFGLPGTVAAGGTLRHIVNVANFGPDSATDVTVEVELSRQLSFGGHLTTETSKLTTQSGGGWACADQDNTVTCVLSGTVAAASLAPTLEIITTVSADALAGTITAVGAVSAAQFDTNMGNNTATVVTTVTGPTDGIFTSGFECIDDCGDPDIVVIDNINFVPAPDFTGGSILWRDGSTCACDIAPFNLNVYGSATTVQFFWPNNANGSEGGVTLNGTTYARLGSGSTIGPDSQFLVAVASAATAPFSNPGNVDGYLGFRFLDNGVTKYGYARITTGSSGRPFTIVSVAFNNAGNPITIP